MSSFSDNPPPGPFRHDFWRSPLRGPWLASLLGVALLIAIPLIFLTGVFSHAAYNPDLGQNRLTGASGIFDLFTFDWPTTPSWLYALNQGTHVTLGIVTIPVLLAKLWSVIPKLFEWPPARSPAHALERISLALLVGGGLFEFATGVLNVQVYYPWKFNFLQAHYYGGWLFMSAFLVHTVLKLATVRRSLRERRLLDDLRVDVAGTKPETPVYASHDASAEPESLVPTNPAAPTMSRRGLLALVGGSSVGLFLLTAGQSIGGPLRRLAVLAPHGRDFGSGPNDFQINKTASAVGIKPAETGSGYRLMVAGRRRLTLSRADLLAMEQHTQQLPIACVEGWSTTQTWTGVRLRDLAALAGALSAQDVHVESLQKFGAFRQATLSHDQIQDPRSLLALKVNGADLSMDHGFPARVIVPALPGVHNTKWVAKMTFSV